MWLAAHRQEIFSAAEVLGSVLPPMLRSFATVFTLLAVDVYSQTDLCTCPYLLPEDLDIRGLRSFDEDRASPVSIRTHCTEDGKLKPHLQHPSQRLPAKREHDARILDALRCVYQLVEDKNVPLSARVAENWLIFEYEPLGQFETSQAQQEPASSSAPAPIANGGVNGNGSAPVPKVHPAATKGPELVAASSPKAIAKDQPVSRSLEQKTANLDDADKTVVNMLSVFLEDPMADTDNVGPSSSTEPSYGMHSATANELAQELLAKFESDSSEPSTRRDLVPETDMFGSGIWNVPYSPVTRSRDLNTTTAAGKPWSNHGSNRSSRTLLPVPEGADDPFASPTHRSVSASYSRPAGNVPTSPAARPISSEDAHRSQLLSVFTDSNARSSPAAQWKQGAWAGESNGGPAQPEASPWTGGDPRRTVAVPSSSNASAFTHMSSLYQGTPNPRAAFEGAGYGAYGNTQPYVGATRDSNVAWPSPRHFQMDEATSNYDAAVFQAAWQGNEG